MVSIRKKTIGNKEYYYLEHTIRKGSKISKRRLYLGTNLPTNLEQLKRNFMFEVNKERWYNTLDKIKQGYLKEEKNKPKSAKEKELETFMVKFTYDTQRIEGSRLTLRETADLLEKGITPKLKPIEDVKEAESHKKIFYQMLDYKKDLNFSIILYWHKELFQLTKPDIAGKIRKHQVAISGSKFIPPLAVEIYPLLMEFFKWYNKNKNKVSYVELAALVHLKFVTIHPFVDGNGRISRLMMNFILSKYNYPMFNIPYQGRNSYYNALERSQVKKLDSIFLNWFMKRYISDNKRHLKS